MKRGGFCWRTNKNCGLTLPILNIIRSQSLFRPLGIFANCVGEQIQGHRTQLLLRHVDTASVAGTIASGLQCPGPGHVCFSQPGVRR